MQAPGDNVQIIVDWLQNPHLILLLPLPLLWQSASEWSTPHLLLNGACGEHAVHEAGPLLAVAPDARHGLLVHGRVPVGVVQHLRKDEVTTIQLSFDASLCPLPT